MLESVKIARRLSEVREKANVLSAVENPTDDQVTEMRGIEKDYPALEVQYRTALLAESSERQQHEKDFETREGTEWAKLVSGFEIRQAVGALDTGEQLRGQTLEAVQEMRSRGQFQGVPIPYAALCLEKRAGETIASGTPNPVTTMNYVDRLFAETVFAKMGGQTMVFDFGESEIPIVTQGVQTGWASSETGDVASPQAFQTADRNLSPDYTLGAQVTLTRKSMKQSGSQLEQAVKRDLNSAIAVALDTACFLGASTSGEPSGLLVGSYSLDVNDISAAASYAAFRAAAVEFLTRNSATSFKDISILMRHELLNTLDSTIFETGSASTEFDFILKRFANVYSTGHALSAPSGSPAESTAVMTTTAGGVAPFVLGLWGALDLIRDVFSGAASGSLRLTGLCTCDFTVIRPAQIGIITGLQ